MTIWNTSRLDIPSTLERQVWDSNTARALPGVGRALALYSGLISGCALIHTKRGEPVEAPLPRLLERPDPDMARPTFVSVHVEDYLLHGNACHLVTARDAYGYPAAVRWYPAHRWYIMPDEEQQPIYHLDGIRVPRANVIHAQRGADPNFPHRGVGVVEQHVRSLNRAGLEEAAESRNLTERGRPDVVIITPNSEPDAGDLDAAADKWVERFSGHTPAPAFLPKDSQVIPLSWNPRDAQMVEARRMSLQDVANIFNLDGYWVGAGAPSHTYRSPGPMFLTMLKVSLNPVMDVLEDVWSASWYARGNEVRFDRKALLQDDLLSMVQAFTTGRQFFPDPNEPRRYMGFPALEESAFDVVLPEPPAPPDEPEPEEDPEPDTPPADELEDTEGTEE
jgi:hypothetical protein